MRTSKILIVDDETSLVQLCKFILEQAGYPVRAAYSGFQALKIIQKDMPDVVILDVMMPGMTGIEVCQNIRESFGPKEPFIVMYTADSRDTTREQCMDAGANKFVTKSISPFDLPKQFENRLIDS